MCQSQYVVQKLSPLRIHKSAWELLSTDMDARLTAVAVGIARLGEAPVSAMNVSARAFQGTGRALSAAAGRLSYTYNLKVLLFEWFLNGFLPFFCRDGLLCYCGRSKAGVFFSLACCGRAPA